MVTAIIGVLMFPLWWYSGVPPSLLMRKKKICIENFDCKETNEMKNNEITHIPAGLFTPNPYL